MVELVTITRVVLTHANVSQALKAVAVGQISTNAQVAPAQTVVLALSLCRQLRLFFAATARWGLRAMTAALTSMSVNPHHARTVVSAEILSLRTPVSVWTVSVA